MLRAFSSYAWKAAEDTETVGRLVAELRLRGFTVFRDRDSLPPGANLEGSIRDELRRSHLVMPLLTPSSVQSDPVGELEFKAARDLHRDIGRPVLVPIVRNLGATHADVTAATFDRLGHDFASRWVTLASDGDDPLRLPEVAQIAATGLRAVLRPGEGPDDGTWKLTVATRGDRPVAEQLLIDATDLLGGQGSRVGDSETWRRVLAGACDLKRVLTEHGRRREILIEPRCHLSAAVATGWAFRFAAGWSPRVLSNGETFERAAAAPGDQVTRTIDPGAFTLSGGTLAVIVDLVPRGISRCATDSFAEPARATIHYHRQSDAPLSPRQTAELAVWIAQDLKRERGELKAARVDLYLCAPAAFAVLFGAELGAVGCPLRLHENDADTYLTSIELPE